MPKTLDLSKHAAKLKDYFFKHRRLPSFSEMQTLLGYRSKGGVSRLIGHLLEQGIVKKDRQGRLIPSDFFSGHLRLLGTVQAGFPSPAEEELLDTLSLDEFLIQKPDASYLVKVTGDSMVDAGIQPDDLVIVERGRTAKTGDIVIAQVDGEWTMKYLEKRQGKTFLRAGNRRYPVIRPKQELFIAGVVVANVRKYH